MVLQPGAGEQCEGRPVRQGAALGGMAEGTTIIHGLLESDDVLATARAVEIAGNLGVSQASVSAMLRRLDAEGFVVHERYRGLVLTAKGRQLACEIIERHDILTRLLRRFGIDEETIYRDVEGMEHHISPETLRVLTLVTEELEGNPTLARRLRRRLDAEEEIAIDPA